MRVRGFILILPALAAAASFEDLCTVSGVQGVLPAAGFLAGVTPTTSSVTANVIKNYTVSANKTIDVCNVTFAYSHDGRSDKTVLWYWLPSPDAWQHRFLATGGGGLSITSGEGGLAGGLPYGAATGTTDGGFGSFSHDLSTVLLSANGTMNLDMLYSFGYLGIHEMAVLGKELTRKFYAAADRVWAYYSGCSEGGREGWSQVQRYGDQFDGAAIGAPAFRQAFQQVLHVLSAVVEMQAGYFPPPCELQAITSDTIAACDGLDGRVDGVISRSDLCVQKYNTSSAIGKPYNCSASSGGGMFGGPPGGPGGPGGLPGGPGGAPGGGPPGGGMGGPPGGFGGTTPAQVGTVSAKGAAVAQAINDGIVDSRGRRAYVSFAPGSGYVDGSPSYDATLKQFTAPNTGIGSQYVNLFLREVDTAALDLANATGDTLRGWILEGMQKFAATLQTDWPDLEGARAHGAKVVHYHGEADNSVPTISSTLYADAVRRTMFPDANVTAGFAQLGDFYRLFLVPGAGHCGPSQGQPGPWPDDVLGAVIEWAERGVVPATLAATVSGGPHKGEKQPLCSFPLRPEWDAAGALSCVWDESSYAVWTPKLDSIPLPVW